MARQRISAPGATATPQDTPPVESTPEEPQVPVQPENIGPQIWANETDVTYVYNYELSPEQTLVQGTWEDLDLTSDPTFSISILHSREGYNPNMTASFERFDKRFGTSGTWTVKLTKRPLTAAAPDILRVTITDDRGATASVDVNVHLLYGPFVRIDAGEEVTTWETNDNAVVNGNWFDLDRGTSFSAGLPTTWLLTPNVGTINYSATPTPLAGSWDWSYNTITTAQAGEYELRMQDSDGNISDPVHFTVNVNPPVPNVLPTIDITLPGTPVKFLVAFAGDIVNVAGTWTDTDNTGNVSIVEHTGSLGSVSVPSPGDTSGSFSWSAGPLVASDAGTIQFKITDEDGAEAFDYFYLFVQPTAPQLNATPKVFHVEEGAIVTSDLSWSDGDGIETGPGIAQYQINPAIGSIDAIVDGTTGTNTWTSPVLTNAEHDGQQVVITLIDGNGQAASVTLTLNVEAPAALIPPTIDAPLLEADALGLADYQVRLTEGSPGVIAGIWGDDDASVSKPVADIVTITTFNAQPFGTISPLPGASAFDSTSGDWQISTFAHNAAQHHNAILRVTITDDDGQTDSLTIRLDLQLDDDPLTTLAGHPEPASAAYWDIDPGLQSWTADARAEELGAGLVVGSQFQQKIEFNISGDSGVPNLDTYVPQFRAYQPAGTTLRAQVYETPNGGSETLTQDHTIDVPLQPTPKPFVTVDTPFEPLLEKKAGQNRAGVFASVHHKNGTYRLYYVVDVTGGTRDLYQTSSTNPNSFAHGTLLKSRVENIIVEDSGSGGLKMIGTEKLTSGNIRVFEGTSTDLTNWTFSIPTQPPTPGYPIGDLICSINSKHIMKGHGWSDSTYGYRRHFFYNSQELTGLLPPDPSADEWYDTYGLSLFRPADHGWASLYEYVGIQWLFHVTSYGSTKANQYGNIIPVWVASSDLVSWTRPFGIQPVFPIQSWYAGMVLHATNPIVVGTEMLQYYTGHSYEHNRFNPNDANQTVGVGLARVTKAAFEAAFGTIPSSQSLNEGEGGWSVTLDPVAIANEGDASRVVVWNERRPSLPIVIPQAESTIIERSLFERVPDTPPPVGDLVWEFRKQVSAASWDAHVADNSRFSTTGSARRYASHAPGVSNRLSMDPNNRMVDFPINFIAPERNTDGSLKCYLSLDSYGPHGEAAPGEKQNYESHCMIRPFISSAEGVFDSGVYTKEGQAYRWDQQIYLPPGKDYVNTDWFIVWQLHPGGYPSGFDSKNPIVALYVDNGVWEGVVRGSDQVTPTTYTQIITETLALTPGTQNISIECRLDALDEFAGGGYCRMTINGQTFVDVKTGPVGFNHSALGAGKVQAACTVGYYGSHPDFLVSGPENQPWVDLQGLKIYKL